MLFSKDLLKESQNRTSYNSLSEDFDVVPYGLDLLSESDDTIRNLLEIYFKNALQYSVVSESMSFREGFNKEFNFDEIILKIFGTYLNNIEKIYIKGYNASKSQIKESFTVNKYKKYIKAYIDDNTHKAIDITLSNQQQGFKLVAPFEHYNYTNLDAVIPPKDSNSKFREVSDSLQDKVESAMNSKESIALIEALKKIYNDSIGHEEDEYIDILRSYIIGKYTKIYEDEYDTRLFEFFHNNKTESNGSIVKSKEIVTSLTRYLSAESLLKSEKSYEDKLIKDATAAREYVLKHGRDILSLNKDNDTNINYILLNILKAECNFILDICDAYIVAYSYKWDAICNALAEDKRILFSIILEAVPEEEL